MVHHDKRKSLLIFLVQMFSLNYIQCWTLTDINVSANALRDDDVDYGEYDDILAANRIALIFPGTKWCGPGNIASTNEDLGEAVEPDKCCREHDNCPDLIPAGETKYNLTNDAYYSRLSCECDVRFLRCLHAANSTVANKVGTIYFNVIGTQCYRQDYPIKGCKKKGGIADLGLYEIFLEHACLEEARIYRRRNAELRNLELAFEMPDSEFIGLYRLNKQLVHNLIQELEPFLSSKGGLSIECKVLTALSFYASGSYQRFIGVNAHHKMHQVSVSNCIRAVTLALNNEHFRGKYIKFPQTRQERNIIKHGWFNKKCLEYEYDQTGKPDYQWFDVPNY